jgi:hypothetical protein
MPQGTRKLGRPTLRYLEDAENDLRESYGEMKGKDK